MCGIFGLIIKSDTHIPERDIAGTLTKIAQFSESRGKDSSGISFRNSEDQTISVIKGDIPIRTLLKSNDFDEGMAKSLADYQKNNSFMAFGHARLVTNGSQLNEVNNQPVIKDDILTIHNGIITNVDDLWKVFPGLKREYLIDTEIIPALIRHNLSKSLTLPVSLKNTFPYLKVPIRWRFPLLISIILHWQPTMVHCIIYQIIKPL